MQNENQEIIAKYNFTEQAIAKLKTDYLVLKINGLDDKKGYQAVDTARKDVKTKRVEVEKRRKELKADALEYGRKVDNIAKEITTKLEEIENHLISEQKAIDDEIAKIRAEKEEKERQKLQNRIETITMYMIPELGDELKVEIITSMSDEKFNDVVEKAKARKEQYDIEQEKIKAEQLAEKLEKERVEKEEKEKFEAEKKRFEEEKEKFEAEKRENERLQAEEKAKQDAIIRKQQEEIEAEKREIEKQKEIEKAKIETAERVKKEMQEKADKEKLEAELKAKLETEKIEKQRVEAERKEKVKPVKKKLLDLAGELKAFKLPNIDDETAKDIVKYVKTELLILSNEVINKANKL